MAERAQEADGLRGGGEQGPCLGLLQQAGELVAEDRGLMPEGGEEPGVLGGEAHGLARMGLAAGAGRAGA
jgi:hypothetical protein